MSGIWERSRAFDGKIAVVTGAGRGMGREISLTLGRGGASIAAVERDAVSARDTATAVRDAGADAEAYVCDVSDRAAVSATVDRILERFGRVDILVNNAGTYTATRPLERLTDDEWENVISVNLDGVFYFMRAVLPGMKARRSGHIVNVSSSAGRSVSTFAGAHYTASKAGVLGLTRHAALEYAPDNVNVNAIAPGTIDTPMLRAAASDERIEAEARKIPLRRVGTVQDIADLVAFLCSPAADYITGATIDINGGDLML
jgi:NAD(P)-dependent dehydrogenase (short-subunit alcohol dehydrogenase family)